MLPAAPPAQASAPFPIIGREDSEDDWHAGFEANLLQSARGFSGDVVEMRRIATNHGAQRDNGVKAAAPGQLFCREGVQKLPERRRPAGFSRRTW